MKISLITISPKGCVWKTLRNGEIVEGRIEPDVPRDSNGDYVYMRSDFRGLGTSCGRPFSDLPVFFDATPKLEKFFRALVLKEFTRRWFGIPLMGPSVAVHLVGYSRPIHLGEKLTLKDCLLRWGARNAITSEWPTPYTESQIREILCGEIFRKVPNQSAGPNTHHPSFSTHDDRA